MWDVETVECRKYRSALLVVFRRQSKNHLARWHRSSGFIQQPHPFICCQFLQLRFIWKASAAFICVWHPKRNLLLSTAVLFNAVPGVSRWVRVGGIYNAVRDWSSLSFGRHPKAWRFHSEVWRLLRPLCSVLNQSLLYERVYHIHWEITVKELGKRAWKMSSHFEL